MSDSNYAVVFDGAIDRGAELATVQSRLAALFRLDARQVERLFVGKPVTVKKGLSAEAAGKLAQAFVKAGAMAKVVRLNGAEAPAPEPLSSAMLARHFADSFDRRGPSFAYSASLLSTALLMLLLPLLYAALVVACGWLPVWYLSHVSFPRHPGPYGVLFYFTPVVVSVVTLFFMVKPLFAPRVVQRLPVELSASREPLFFAFIHAIADKVGAPRPHTVEVDCNVNAFAAYHRGFHGLMHRRLTLRVGLPLLVGMNTRQLAGVLAHEFGHFSQRGGMVATYLIRRVNHWFYRAVNERDLWDVRLAVWGEAGGVLGLIALVAALGVGLVRRILALFLWCAEVVSHAMLRQMEFDADSYEARLAGSGQFRETSLRLRRLAYGFQAAFNDLGELWNRRQLVDDFPAMAARKSDELSKQTLAAIEEGMRESRQDVFATHPPDEMRVVRAESLRATGVFTLERPAHLLLKDYEAVARKASLHFYREDLGLQVKEDQLVSKHTMVSTVAKAKQQDESLTGYCRGLFLPYRFLPPPEVAQHARLADMERRQRLNEYVSRMRMNLPEIERLKAEYERISEQITGAYARQVLSQQAQPVVKSFAAGLASRDYPVLQQDLGNAKARLAPLDTAMANRLGTAVGGALAWEGLGAAEREQLQGALRVAEVIHSLQPACDDLALQGGVLFYALQADHILHGHSSGAESLPDTVFALWRRSSENAIRNICSALDGVRYPFERSGGAVTLLGHMKDRLPQQGQDVGQLVEYIGGLLGEMQSQYSQVMRYMTEVATRYEGHLGVDPLSIKLGNAVSGATG